MHRYEPRVEWLLRTCWVASSLWRVASGKDPQDLRSDRVDPCHVRSSVPERHFGRSDCHHQAALETQDWGQERIRYHFRCFQTNTLQCLGGRSNPKRIGRSDAFVHGACAWFAQVLIAHRVEADEVWSRAMALHRLLVVVYLVSIPPGESTSFNWKWRRFSRSYSSFFHAGMTWMMSKRTIPRSWILHSQNHRTSTPFVAVGDTLFLERLLCSWNSVWQEWKPSFAKQLTWTTINDLRSAGRMAPRWIASIFEFIRILSVFTLKNTRRKATSMTTWPSG